MMTLDLSVARLNGLMWTVGGGLGVDGAMGTGSHPDCCLSLKSLVRACRIRRQGKSAGREDEHARSPEHLSEWRRDHARRCREGVC